MSVIHHCHRSLRRSAQLLHVRPDLTIVPLRGNLDTRLKKLASDDENLDAIVLAAAGVKRLGLEARITESIDPLRMLPAVAQGALCIEIREKDSQIATLTACLDDPLTRAVVLGERAFLRRLGGSCQVPVAGHGQIDRGTFSLTGLVAELDGRTIYRETISGEPSASEAIGIRLAEVLLDQGAARVLDALAGEDASPRGAAD